MTTEGRNWAALAAAIEYRMTSHGVSQADLVKTSKLSDVTLRSLMRAKPRAHPRPPTLRKLEIALGWPQGYVDELLGLDPDVTFDPDDMPAGAPPRASSDETTPERFTQPDEILLPSLVELAHQVERIDLDANRQHVATLATNAKIDDLVEVVADLSRRLAVLEARPGRRSSD